MVNLLKRRIVSKNQAQDGSAGRTSTTSRDGLRHSLSLPDLTTPLLDPESWEELPSFAFNPLSGKTRTTPQAQGRSTTGVASGRGGGGGGGGGGVVEPPRGRKASLVGASPGSPGSTPQFHRPFTPWQLVARPGPLEEFGPALPQNAGKGRESTWSGRDSEHSSRADFRVSKSRWGRDAGIVRQSSMTGGEGGWKRRKGKGKAAAKRMNVVVVGGKGVGKTSFINLLIDSFNQDQEHDDHGSRRPSVVLSRTPVPPQQGPPLPRTRPRTADSTPSSPTVPGPPQFGSTLAQQIEAPLQPDTARPSLDDPPSMATEAALAPEDSAVGTPGVNPQAEPRKSDSGRPTTRMYSRLSEVRVPGYDRHHLRVIDTPGLELGNDDGVKERERERGLAGLMRLIEDRYGDVMREESRIVRRGTRGEDDLIHLAIYLIDARTVLHPSSDQSSKIDWSCVGVFDDVPVGPLGEQTTPVEEQHPASQSPDSGPKLSTVDIQVIKRLGERANVLPVLAQTDSLTVDELDKVRSAVREDLSKAFPEHGGFGLFSSIDEEEGRKTPRPDTVAPVGEDDPRPPTPASTIRTDTTDSLPYAIFCPSPSSPGAGQTPGVGGSKGLTRRYAWGVANVLDPEQSDFLELREAILGVHSRALRSTTREVLYEKYRTERLLAKHNVAGRISSDTAKRVA